MAASATPTSTSSRTPSPTASGSPLPPGFGFRTVRSSIGQPYAACISGNGRVVTGLGSTIHTSADGGATWVNPASPSSFWTDCGVNEQGTVILAMGFNAGTFRSTDFGANWTLVPGSNNWYLRDITVSRNGNVVVGAAYAGVRLSFDSGITWVSSGPAVQSTEYVSGCASDDGMYIFVGNSNGGVWRSTDHGSSWAPVANLTSNNWKSLACSADGAVVMAGAGASGSNSVWRSADYGAAWTAVNMTGITGTLAGLQMNADGTTMVMNVGDLWVSRNGGVTWARSDSSAAGLMGNMGVSGDAQVIVGIRYDGIWLSGTADMSLTLPTPTATASAMHPPFVFTKRSTISSGGLGACMSSNGRVITAMTNDKLMTSTDGGATWTTATSPTSGSWQGCGMDETGSRIFVTGWGMDVFTSTNGGATWTALSGSPFFPRFLHVGRNASVLMTAMYGGVSLSFDSGATWASSGGSTLQSRDYAQPCASDDGNYLFVGSNGGGVFRSGDRGSTWAQVSALSTGTWFVHCSVTGQFVLAGAGTAAFVSYDFGVTWSSVAIPGLTGTIGGVKVSSDGSVMVLNAGDLFVSENYGGVWTKQGPSGRHLDGYFAMNGNGTVFAGTRRFDGIYMSTCVADCARAPTGVPSASGTPSGTPTPSNSPAR